MNSEVEIDLKANPMDWLDENLPLADRDADNLEVVGRAARLAVFNHVRCAFEAEKQKGKMDRKRLAAALGVTPSLVGRWLREPSNITIETAARLLFVMGREFRLASQSADRHVGIAAVKDIRWVSYPAVPGAPKFNLRVDENSAVLRCPSDPCPIEMSVFDGDDGVEAWISGPGVPDAYLKAYRPDSSVKRLPLMSYARPKRAEHAST